MQKTPFRNPAPPLDQFLMHDGDLPGRAAEADEAEFEPEAESFTEAYGLRTFHGVSLIG